MYPCSTKDCPGKAVLLGGWCDTCRDKYAPRSKALTFEQKLVEFRKRILEAKIEKAEEDDIPQFDVNELSDEDIQELFKHEPYAIPTILEEN